VFHPVSCTGLNRANLLSPPDLESQAQKADLNKIAQTFSDFLLQTYNAPINPEKEILFLSSGRAALLLLGLSFIDTDRICYVPDPGYYIYRNITILFGGRIKEYSLYQRNDFLPNLNRFEEKKRLRSMRMMFLNSPHNPTGGICDPSFYNRLHKLALAENILLLIDSAYCLNACGSFRPPVFCANRRRLKVGLEMFSFSTNLCAPGLGLTALVGRREFISGLSNLATSVGCLPSKATINLAARYFFSVDELTRHIHRCRKVIEARTAQMSGYLKKSHIEFYPVITSPFVWVKLKSGRVSLSFARGLLRRSGVVVAPGSAVGEQGEGWIRLSANLESEKLDRAMYNFVKYYQPVKTRLQARRKK